MSLLISDNPIVTTYPRYNVATTYKMEDIHEWLKPHSLVGIGLGLNYRLRTNYRVYAKLTPEDELMFIIKFEATRYDKAGMIKTVKDRLSGVDWTEDA